MSRTRRSKCAARARGMIERVAAIARLSMASAGEVSNADCKVKTAGCSLMIDASGGAAALVFTEGEHQAVAVSDHKLQLSVNAELGSLEDVGTAAAPLGREG